MNKHLTVKTLVVCAMFIALSAVGAFFKPFGNSIAFDSLPAFLAASMLGPAFGAVVGVLGHLISAAVTGFAPMGLVLHLVVALEMIVVMYVYGFVARRFGLAPASVLGIILNGVAATAVFIPILGMPFFLAMVGPLTLVSAINVVLAVLVQLALQRMGVVRSLDCVHTKLWGRCHA